LIRDEINDYYKGCIAILDSTDVVKNEVCRILSEENLLCKRRFAEDLFYVSDFTSSFEETAKNSYGEDIKTGSYAYLDLKLLSLYFY